MVEKTVANELRTVPAFSNLPDEEMQWLMENGSIMELAESQYLFRKGEEANYMYVILQGKVQMLIEQNGQSIPVSVFNTGYVTGVLPYSRMKINKANGYTLEKTTVFALHRTKFFSMVTACPELVRNLVEIMTTRVREFTQSQAQREKLVSLSKLSAGLAHELNNPASAIARSSAELNKRMAQFPKRVHRLFAQQISPDKLVIIKQLLERKAQQTPINLSPIERSEREDELVNWLDDRQVEDSFCFAETFVKAGIAISDMEEIAAQLPAEALPAAISWMDSMLTAQALLREVEQAAGRISHIIDSIKSYTHMDQANDLQWVDPLDGLYSTLAILNHKLQAKKIRVNLDQVLDSIQIRGYVSELNQLWTNLIDNAIDAMSENGELAIATEREGNFLLIHVMDNGSGIPPEIHNKIFDPFFTTKPLGKGTGLGLDIASRIVMNHNGTIQVESAPGRTVFTISFPVELAG